VGDDQLWGITREHKGADHTLAVLKSIRAARPDGYRLFVIMDNLAANKTPAIRRWALARKLQACPRWRNAPRPPPRRGGRPARERARIRSERQQRWGRQKPKAA
jgi:hypothetical protein